MELRQYIEILKRHRWFIVEAVVVVAVAAGLVSALRTPVYRAEASLFLRPNDPSEQLDPAGAPRPAGSDADRYVAAQRDIAASAEVARAAAKSLAGVSAGEVIRASSADQRGRSDVLVIWASDHDPARARDIANAVARSYVENRRLSAVAGLDKAITDIELRLVDLQSRIAELDGRIGTSNSPATGASGATPTPQQPSNPIQPTAGPEGAATQSLNLGGQPTSDESLKAARYAAAVQYESLFSRQQDLLVEQNLKRGEAEVIQLAGTPSAPTSPKPPRDVLLGALLGLLLGVSTVFLREQLDDRIRSREEAEHANELPLLAELPRDESTAGHTNVAAATVPHGPLAEASRSLRTSLLFLGIEQPIRRILITSPGPGEGKSVVASNLAAVFAQAGQKTVLVSADLRRPSLERLFDIDRHGLGLSELVSAQVAPLEPRGGRNGIGSTPQEGVGDALVPVRPENLYLLRAGQAPPNPAELLGSNRMNELLDELGSMADIVVIDSPPLLAVTDAAALAPKVDAVLIVNSLGETHRSAARRARELVANADARHFGLVLNKVDQSKAGYYGYYSYYGADSAQDRQRGRSRFGRRVARTGGGVDVSVGAAATETIEHAAVGRRRFKD